jgi:hypothetical protein
VNLLTHKPVQSFLSDYQDPGKGEASVAGLVMQARSLNKVSRRLRRKFPRSVMPLGNAPVYLSDFEDGCYIAAGLTDKAGRFFFQNIPHGEYCIKIDHRGSTRCDPESRLKIDAKISNLDFKAIISPKHMVTRIITNPLVHLKNPMAEGIHLELKDDTNVFLRTGTKIPLTDMKIEVSDLSGWIVFFRCYGDVPPGYEADHDLNHLGKGDYIIRISGSNYSLCKKLTLQ